MEKNNNNNKQIDKSFTKQFKKIVWPEHESEPNIDRYTWDIKTIYNTLKTLQKSIKYKKYIITVNIIIKIIIQITTRYKFRFWYFRDMHIIILYRRNKKNIQTLN